jgi:hypothetical protein
MTSPEKSVIQIILSGLSPLKAIFSWLGHASIETTNAYVEIDLEMKRKTLQSCEKLLPKKGRQGSLWQRNSDILSWLSSM